MTLRVGVLASGTGSNLQAILDACREERIPARVVAVVSDRRDAKALERARSAGAAAHFVGAEGKSREEHDREVASILEKADVGLVCLAGYMRILSPWFVGRFKGKLVNIHPALLPSFPGLHGQRQALEWGAKVAGCTVHFVDEALDHGPIIMQAAVPVREEDKEETLANRILAQEHRIYPMAIKLFAEGRLQVEGRRVRVKGTGNHSGGNSSPPVEP